jgi:hypothetical protein
MKTYIKNIFVILFLLGGTAVYSAPGRPPPPPGGGGASCWPPPCMPVDNGVIFLIAVAALYGGKKLYDFHKKAEA